ncbi:cyclin-D1-binding protein 1 [Hemicordylus capensis]|uniref:cyclin-D1-binding protein 1 n=1 Tax=Hemicordylus capensis TaxID=884348 RepID=UPI0023044BE3|nr:cyclin-D1-binding protein 1 [Hemicordylus capensis]
MACRHLGQARRAAGGGHKRSNGEGGGSRPTSQERGGGGSQAAASASEGRERPSAPISATVRRALRGAVLVLAGQRDFRFPSAARGPLVGGVNAVGALPGLPSWAAAAAAGGRPRPRGAQSGERSAAASPSPPERRPAGPAASSRGRGGWPAGWAALGLPPRFQARVPEGQSGRFRAGPMMMPAVVRLGAGGAGASPAPAPLGSRLRPAAVPAAMEAAGGAELARLREALRAALARLRGGESGEGGGGQGGQGGGFERGRFWEALGRAFQAASQEATKFSLAFAGAPRPSPEECAQLSQGLRVAVLAAASVYYRLPKDQGTTLRKVVRDAAVELLEGTIHLTEGILRNPLQSLSPEQLVSTGGIWEVCERVSCLPRDNQAAVALGLASCLGVVKDALEEMEQAQGGGGDPYGDVLEDEDLGSRGNRDVYWSESDRQLLGPCLGLVKAARACLKRVLGAVKAHGGAQAAEQVAQLDDLADIARDVSPSVDELALSTYPPVNQLTLRLNAAKLASVLQKLLEVARASHVCPPPEESWVQFLARAVDHNLDKIKDLTQGLL